MIYDFNFKILICLIILSLILVVLCKKIFNKNFKEIIALLLICFYFILIIYKTQFPIFINNEVMETELGGIKLGRDVNLIPFKDFAHMTSLLNIVMFIPIGFLQEFVVKNNWKKNIIVGFILSLVVESSQLLVNMLIGYNFRTFDVNDLIFNTIGALIGYLKLFGIISLLKNSKVVTIELLSTLNQENKTQNPQLYRKSP